MEMNILFSNAVLVELGFSHKHELTEIYHA